MNRSLIYILITLLLATFAFCYLYGAKREVKEIGVFEYESSKTKVFEAGGCTVFATKWKSSENPSFYFNCK